METRANYVLIGVVTLLGIAGVFAFFLWYAKVQIDRSYDYYDVLFDQVTGLNRAADVRFNGIPVGQVIGLNFDRGGSGQVRVRLEVADGTPIRADTVATLESQGVTGVSFVSLSGGRPDSPPLEPPEDGALPVIPSTPSVLQSLIEGAPELLQQATSLLVELQGFVSPENQDRVTGILGNVEAASGGLEQALADFSQISNTVRDGVSEISVFTGRLDGIAAQLERTLATADTTLGAATGAFEEARGALDAARQTFESADSLIVQQAPGLVEDYAAAAQSVTTRVDALAAQAGGVLEEFEAAGALAAARLREAEAPLAAATPALNAVEAAANEFETLTGGDGALLIAEMRTAVGLASQLIETDAQPILADVREAAATVNRVVAQVGGDFTDLSGRLGGVVAEAEGTLAEAGVTFRAAAQTLRVIEPTIEVAGRTLASADAAFQSADAAMATELGPLVADLRSAVAQFDGAMAQVSADLPAISAEVRSAAEAANLAAQQLNGIVSTSGPPVTAFATSALPQFTRLSQDARALVASLDSLIQRIERDPARFFLGRNAPEYQP